MKNEGNQRATTFLLLLFPLQFLSRPPPSPSLPCHSTYLPTSSYRPPPPPQMRKNLSPSKQERDSPRYQKAGTFFTTKIIHSSIPSPIKQFRKIFISEKNFPSSLSDRLIASPPPLLSLRNDQHGLGRQKKKFFFATTKKKAKMEREEEENWTQLRSGVGDLVTSLITGKGWVGPCGGHKNTLLLFPSRVGDFFSQRQYHLQKKLRVLFFPCGENYVSSCLAFCAHVQICYGRYWFLHILPGRTLFLVF